MNTIKFQLCGNCILAVTKHGFSLAVARQSLLLVHPHMKSHFKFVQNLNLMRKIVPFAILDKFIYLFFFLCCVLFFVCLQIYLEAAIHKNGLICLGNPQATVVL